MPEEKTEKKPDRKHRLPMKEQAPEDRVKNFNEVPFGYTAEDAIAEASRCLFCKKPACVAGCPVEIDIPGFIRMIQEGNFAEAAQRIKEKNSLPAICGRVCPQEDQCEMTCILGKKGDPVAIGNLERFAADFEASEGEVTVPKVPPKNGHKVAVVGSGPAGLTVASDLVLLGYDVTIYEAFHKSGGVLVYGIPEFRLPKAIVQREVDYLKKLGVKIVNSALIGKTITLDQLLGPMGYGTVFVATGAGLPMFFGIPGEDLNGIYSSNEFLTRANLMKAYRFPEYDTPIRRGKKVAVFGGGNTAMDSARTALRLGAEKVYLVYRRSKTEMPARDAEIHHAEEEGIDFQFLTNPIRFLGDEEGTLTGMECIRMKLGEPDSSGRKRPIPVKGSEFIREIDTAVVAVGTKANPLLLRTAPDLKLNKWGYIEADEMTGKTSKKGVFAGGDIVTGGATVILAMGAGRRAANAIHEYLQSGHWSPPPISDE